MDKRDAELPVSGPDTQVRSGIKVFFDTKATKSSKGTKKSYDYLASWKGCGFRLSQKQPS